MPPRARATAKDKAEKPAEEQAPEATEGEVPTSPDEPAAPAEGHVEPKPKNVIEAIHAVMREVTFVGKDGFNEQNRFNFRGIDGTINALGPAFRKHGLVVLPVLKGSSHDQVETGRNRTAMNWTRVEVEYRFYGPGGVEDTISVVTPGESFDSGDKGTAKAMSVAFRTALLQAFALPTQERDPDADSHELSNKLTGAEVQTAVAQELEKAEVEGRDQIAALKVVWDSFGEKALNAVQVQRQDGSTVTGAAYINGWVEHINKKRQAEADARRAQQDQQTEGPARDESAQGAQDERAQQEQPAAQKQDAHALLMDEIGHMAQTLEVQPAAFVAPLIEKHDGARKVVDVPAAKVLEWVVSQRPKVVEALRAKGEASAAQAYASMPPVWGRWIDLTSPRETERAQEPVNA